MRDFERYRDWPLDATLPRRLASADRDQQIQPKAVPKWVQPYDGNALFGLREIAQYLELSTVSVQRLAQAGLLPTTYLGRDYSSTRYELASYIVTVERQAVRQGFALSPPDDISQDGCLGLLRGLPAMAAYLNATIGQISHQHADGALPTFKLGGTCFARRVSLDSFKSRVRLEKDPAFLDPDVIVGTRAIAAYFGIGVRTLGTWTRDSALPTFLIHNQICVRRSSLLEMVIRLEKSGLPPHDIATSGHSSLPDNSLELVRGCARIAKLVTLCRTQVNLEIKAGRLASFLIGGLRFARLSSLERFNYERRREF